MSTAYATPIINDNVETYKIYGATANELRQQMNENGIYDHGGRFDANTSWYVKWDFHYQDSSVGCSLSDITVSVDITMHLPEWADKQDANDPLQEQWVRYLTLLRMHERGHRDNGIKAARDIDYMLNNLPSMPSCSTLESEANSKAYSILKEYNAADLSYDSETDHGKNQGAIFP